VSEKKKSPASKRAVIGGRARKPDSTATRSKTVSEVNPSKANVLLGYRYCLAIRALYQIRK